jgi:hypothetical protein
LGELSLKGKGKRLNYNLRLQNALRVLHLLLLHLNGAMINKYSPRDDISFITEKKLSKPEQKEN